MGRKKDQGKELIATRKELQAARDAIKKQKGGGRRLLQIAMKAASDADVYERNIQEEVDRFETFYTDKGIIKPPYTFSRLYTIYEESDVLQTCIEAMIQNIDGFGYKLPFVGDDIKEKETDAAKAEKVRLENFLDYANEDESWRVIRKKARQDLEVLGNGAFEILRNRAGRVHLAYHASFQDLRMSKLQKKPIPVKYKIPRDGKMVEVEVKKYFRRYAQLGFTGKKLRWFKEFGDPRPMDAITGEYKSSNRQCKQIASEIWHFKYHFGSEIYGIPRWIGAIMQVMGRRYASFVNYDLFDNQGIPPMVITVSNGTLTDESWGDLEAMVQGMRGVTKWNRIAVLESEVESAGLEDRGTAKLELKNLADFRKDDLMFEKYLDSSSKDVRYRYRIPPLYIGAADIFTHACSSTDTETLTSRGWITIDEFRDGDRIATLNPTNNRLEYHEPEEVHIYPSPKEMVLFQSRGADVCVTRNHDMWVRKYIRSMPQWEKQHAEEVLFSATKTHLWKVAPEETEFGIVPESVPISDLEMMLEFIGYAVSDGHISKAGNAIRFQVKKPRKKSRYRAFLKSVANKIGGGYHDRLEKGLNPYLHIDVKHKELNEWAENNLLTESGEKKLPDWVWELDASLSSHLLDCLVFGDGCTKGRGPNSQVYVTTSKLLADQVQAIGFRCGMRARIVPVDGSDRGRKITYYVHMTNTTTLIVKQESIKMVSPPTKRVYCFHVKNHLFVTRRNGKISIHGNTAKASQTVGEEQVFIPERQDFDEIWNNKITRRELGCTLWRMESKGPKIAGSSEISKGVEVFTKAGAISINNAIDRANEALGLEMSRIDAEWANFPLTLILELIKMGRPLKGMEILVDTDNLGNLEGNVQQLEGGEGPKQLMLPGATEKFFKSNMFSEKEKLLYRMLIGLQDAAEKLAE